MKCIMYDQMSLVNVNVVQIVIFAMANKDETMRNAGVNVKNY